MKKILSVVIILITLIIQGCVPSVHPLYSADTIVTDSRLEGTWENESENEIWTFKKTKYNNYNVTYTENEETSNIIAHLVKLENSYYLDFYPANDLDVSDFYKTHLVPAHTFTKVSLSKDKLSIQAFNPEWLSQQIKNRYIRIKHEQIDNSILITAPTSDLQKFVIKYSNHSTGDEEFFLQSSVLTKKQ